MVQRVLIRLIAPIARDILQHTSSTWFFQVKWSSSVTTKNFVECTIGTLIPAICIFTLLRSIFLISCFKYHA